MGGLEDTGAWGLAWAALAAAAGLSLAAVATTLLRRSFRDDEQDLARGYNAMASLERES